MNKQVHGVAPAFTLLELMLVIAVIGILMGMVGAAAYSARQRAYAAKATAETQQIATAFKAYYLAHQEWPGAWKNGKAFTELTENNLEPLIGGGEDGIVYLDVNADAFEDGRFVDPWGNPYEVSTEGLEKPVTTDVFEGAVSFPNAMRHYFEEGVYGKDSSAWDWDDYDWGL